MTKLRDLPTVSIIVRGADMDIYTVPEYGRSLYFI